MTPTEYLLSVYCTCRYLSNGNLSTATESPTATEESPEERTMTNNNCLHHGHRSELSLCDLGTWDWALWEQIHSSSRPLGANLGCLNLEGGFGSHNHEGDIWRRYCVDNADHHNN